MLRIYKLEVFFRKIYHYSLKQTKLHIVCSKRTYITFCQRIMIVMSQSITSVAQGSLSQCFIHVMYGCNVHTT